MPMVGMSIELVIAAAMAGGTHSKTTAKHPAFQSRCTKATHSVPIHGFVQNNVRAKTNSLHHPTLNIMSTQHVTQH